MIGLLLHHHQPDYRDPDTGEPALPWVRHHAIRGYRDVAVAIRESGAQVTVNLVPSLIDQWEHYAAGGTDRWLRLVERPTASIEPHEAEWMLDHFFVGNPRMFGWFPAFGRLRAHRQSGERFSTQELRDVTVWSQLAWFGWSALRDWPDLAELRRKARGFTEADKARVVAVQRLILAELRALHRDLPEVSASPYYHPILPLLVDTAHAERSMPGVPDPGFRHPEDALDQLVRGRARVEAWLGRPVRGLWPAEGSVSPEVVALAERAGFAWLATDEEVLQRSERDGNGPAPAHHGTWICGGLRAIFRDRALSDRVGFAYADLPAADAVSELLERAAPGMLLALDGENPWEAFADAGEAFLRELFARAPLVTCGELAAAPARGRVTRLHTGSWIGAAFHIWIGHPEDRAAWALLARCRADWEAAGRPEAAREHLYAAEGSDWFWWYGEDFETPVAGEFDRLFRAHLAAAWRAMDRPAPPEVHTPIKRPSWPREPVRGAWDGPPGEDWFTWARAGRVRLRGGAMAPDRALPRAVELGHAGDEWWMRRRGGRGGWVAVLAAATGEGERVEVGEGWTRLGGRPVALIGPDGLRVDLPDTAEGPGAGGGAPAG